MPKRNTWCVIRIRPLIGNSTNSTKVDSWSQINKLFKSLPLALEIYKKKKKKTKNAGGGAGGPLPPPPPPPPPPPAGEKWAKSKLILK